MSGLLLDTHTFYWFVFDSSKLSATAQEVLSAQSHQVFVSDVSVWESCIKVGLGKLDLRQDVVAFFERAVAANGFSFLPIERRHFREVTSLPLHHRDPFDRLLVSQCLTEGLTLVSADKTLDRYQDVGLRRTW